MSTTVYKITSDEWYPSYKMSNASEATLVRVSFTKAEPDDRQWIVSAWGGDDCGMEKVFKDEKDAWLHFLQVVCLDDVTRAALNSMGFVSA